MPERAAPAECANCGAALTRGVKACPGCGADERTGWRENEDSLYDGLDLPDPDESENESAPARDQPARRVNGIAWYWWCAGVAVLALLVFSALGLR